MQSAAKRDDWHPGCRRDACAPLLKPSKFYGTSENRSASVEVTHILLPSLGENGRNRPCLERPRLSCGGELLFKPAQFHWLFEHDAYIVCKAARFVRQHFEHVPKQRFVVARDLDFDSLATTKKVRS